MNTNQILLVYEMFDNENNPIKIATAERMVENFPEVHVLCHDCNCVLGRRLLARGLCRYAYLGAWHSKKHVCAKKWHPEEKAAFTENLNSSICEQVWSQWDKMSCLPRMSRGPYRMLVGAYAQWRNAYMRDDKRRTTPRWDKACCIKRKYARYP